VTLAVCVSACLLIRGGFSSYSCHRRPADQRVVGTPTTTTALCNFSRPTVTTVGYGGPLTRFGHGGWLATVEH